MSGEPPRTSPVSVGIAAGLGVLILLVWALELTLLSDLSGSDAAGRGLAEGYAVIGLFILWLLLAVLAILAFIKGPMPGAAAIAALALIPVSGALARIRNLDRRQADAELMLTRAEFPLRYLGAFKAYQPAPESGLMLERMEQLHRKR